MMGCMNSQTLESVPTIPAIPLTAGQLTGCLPDLFFPETRGAPKPLKIEPDPPPSRDAGMLVSYLEPIT